MAGESVRVSNEFGQLAEWRVQERFIVGVPACLGETASTRLRVARISSTKARGTTKRDRLKKMKHTVSQNGLSLGLAKRIRSVSSTDNQKNATIYVNPHARTSSRATPLSGGD